MNRSFTRWSILVLAVLLVSGCSSLPPRPETPYSSSLGTSRSGELAEFATRFESKHPANASGVSLLFNARDAMLARLALLDLARDSVDITYFIWQDDEIGALLFDRVLRTADRGVRVRILVDDMGVLAKSRELALFSAHPNLEIRLFNPNPSRDNTVGWGFRYLASFKELNRRMHNKLLIADGQVALVGGRNVGNPYFGLSDKYNFFDMDVLATGAVVEEAAFAFDDYWNADHAFPASAWGDRFDLGAFNAVRAANREYLEESADRLASYPLQPANWGDWLDDMEGNLIPGAAHFLQDSPVEIAGSDYRLSDMIDYFVDRVESELLVSSPYLIPAPSLLDYFAEVTGRGASVRLLTSSLGSNNHTSAHSHYRKYRRDILAGGSELYEFHHEPPAEVRVRADVSPVRADFISLHAKTIVADRKKTFIGSLNFDPRAMVINTENGLLVESEAFSEQVAGVLEKLMSPDVSWQVRLDPAGAMYWESSFGTVNSQPARGTGQRVADFFLRLLPIESQL